MLHPHGFSGQPLDDDPDDDDIHNELEDLAWHEREAKFWREKAERPKREGVLDWQIHTRPWLVWSPFGDEPDGGELVRWFDTLDEAVDWQRLIEGERPGYYEILSRDEAKNRF